MYFYKSKLWDSFTDFDKLSFSIICGFITFIGLVVPLARIIFSLTYFVNGFEFVEIESDEVITTYKQIYSFILLGLFVLTFISSKPLYDNTNIVKKFFLMYFIFFSFLFATFTEFFLSIFCSQFRDYHLIMSSNLLDNLFLIFVFFFVHLSVHKKSIPFISREVQLFLKKSRLKKQHSILFAALLILLPLLVGNFLFSYTVSENNERIEYVSIKEINIGQADVLSAKQIIFRDYSIKMPVLISWAKVKPDLPIKTPVNSESEQKYVVLEDENAFVINKTSKIENITVVFYNDTEILYSKMLKVTDLSFTNNSMFINISLTNYLPHNIEIETISVPIHSNYSLEEKDFVKTQFFADYRGAIQGYIIRNEYLFLTNVRLEKNASGTIRLKLNNVSV